MTVLTVSGLLAETIINVFADESVSAISAARTSCSESARRYNPRPCPETGSVGVREREELGSRRSRRLRAQGLIPGILYGRVTRARSSFPSAICAPR